MKGIFRLFIFSCFALFLTSYWNKGFFLPVTAVGFVKAGIALTVIFALIRPLMKVVFLPLNIITFGLFSFFLYVFLLHILSSWYGMFSVKAWEFYGIHTGIIDIPKTSIGYVGNLVLSSFSLSSIISTLDQVT